MTKGMNQWRKDVRGLTARELVNRIRAAFPPGTPPALPSLEDEDPEGDCDHYGFLIGLRWDEVNVETLKWHHSARHFLPKSAAEYYLPSWIVASLTSFGEPGGIVSQGTYYWIDEVVRSFGKETSAFTHDQQQALVAVLTYLADETDDVPECLEPPNPDETVGRKN